MKANKCMDCPHKIANFMSRTCELTGKTIPLFSEPAGCPLKEENKWE